MKKKFIEDIKILTDIISVDGSEEEAARYLKTRLENTCDRVEVTNMGTVIGYINGKKNGKKILITAHCDEIGFMVKNITDDGFILFEKVGDYSDKLIPARKVWIQAGKHRIPGVIGLRAAHVMTSEEAGRVQTAKQSYIDVGVFSREEVEGLGIKLGDKIVLQSDFMEMANPDLICTRALDDRVGCALLLNLMEAVDRDQLEGEIVAVFSVLEETTIAGLAAPANYIDPDYIIVLDTVPCGDVPDVDTDKELPVYMNRGPVLIVAQGDPNITRYSCMHPKLRDGFYNAASRLNMELQELVISENVYITEESMMYSCGKGIPAATLAIPRRYSHTPVELLHINDAIKTFDVLKKFIEINGAISLEFI